MLEFKRMNSIARFAQQFEVFDRSPHQRDVPVELVADPLHLLSPTAVLVIDLKKWRSIAKTANATKVAASDQQHRPASVLAVFLGGIAGPVRDAIVADWLKRRCSACGACPKVMARQGI